MQVWRWREGSDASCEREDLQVRRWEGSDASGEREVMQVRRWEGSDASCEREVRGRWCKWWEGGSRWWVMREEAGASLYLCHHLLLCTALIICTTYTAFIFCTRCTALFLCLFWYCNGTFYNRYWTGICMRCITLVLCTRGTAMILCMSGTCCTCHTFKMYADKMWYCYFVQHSLHFFVCAAFTTLLIYTACSAMLLFTSHIVMVFGT